VSEWNSTFKTLNDPADTKIPIVVLTNNMSASSSEIVSGSLQDYDRAVILGQKTYGKGLVQITKNLSYNTMLKVTTAKYYIPSGRCIQAINYSDRDEEGGAKHIPDSLKKEFKTAAGRRVLDGGGVDPDLPITKASSSPLIEALLARHTIFDYATQYRTQHPSIATAAAFKISEKEYEEFITFAKARNYSYKTESDRLLDRLKETATDESYYDAVKTQYEDIKKKLEEDKQSALLKNKAVISTLLEDEICGRYYFLHGKIEKSLQNDPLAIKAIELLTTGSAEYRQLLAKR
jgi:carboxyl-terminal processing protease